MNKRLCELRNCCKCQNSIDGLFVYVVEGCLRANSHCLPVSDSILLVLGHVTARCSLQITHELSMLDQLATMTTKMNLPTKRHQMAMLKAIKSEAIFLAAVIQKREPSTFKQRAPTNIKGLFVFRENGGSLSEQNALFFSGYCFCKHDSVTSWPLFCHVDGWS